MSRLITVLAGPLLLHPHICYQERWLPGDVAVELRLGLGKSAKILVLSPHPGELVVVGMLGVVWRKHKELWHWLHIMDSNNQIIFSAAPGWGREHLQHRESNGWGWHEHGLRTIL